MHVSYAPMSHSRGAAEAVAGSAIALTLTDAAAAISPAAAR
jgi:hypothetical protein